MTEPSHGAMHAALAKSLAAQRRHVLGIVDGLEDAALRRPVLPSGWTCLGLVQHLALDVERFWFGAVAAGDPVTIAGLDTVEDAWQVDATAPASTALDLYRQTVSDADAVIASTPLAAAPAWWPADLFGDFRLHSLGEIMLHVIGETACHAGHLDAARELLDGRQWFVIED